MNTIPTNKGEKTLQEIVYDIMYECYEANRDNGNTHEQLISIGIGNDAMKLKYENSKNTK